MDYFSAEALSALIAIIIIDLVLAGDNAIVIALVARGLPQHLRRKTIIWGTVGAVGIRAAMTLMVVWLLGIPGLLAVGGLFLVWVAYKLLAPEHDHSDNPGNLKARTAGLWAAIRTIIIADAVMGVDNVLGAEDLLVLGPVGQHLGVGLLVVHQEVGLERLDAGHPLGLHERPVGESVAQTRVRRGGVGDALGLAARPGVVARRTTNGSAIVRQSLDELELVRLADRAFQHECSFASMGSVCTSRHNDGPGPRWVVTPILARP